MEHGADERLATANQGRTDEQQPLVFRVAPPKERLWLLHAPWLSESGHRPTLSQAAGGSVQNFAPARSSPVQ